MLFEVAFQEFQVLSREFQVSVEKSPDFIGTEEFANMTHVLPESLKQYRENRIFIQLKSVSLCLSLSGQF